MKTRIDPFGVLEKEGYGPLQLLDMVGPLPLWARGYYKETGQTLRGHMEECYGYPLSYDDTGQMDSKFIFRYPGDAELLPLFIAQWDNGQAMAVYHYGLVSFIDYDKDKQLKQYHTRMD